MRALIDLTNSPHVPFFAPLIRELKARGDEVVVTARRFAQTIELAQAHNLDAHVVGTHGGTSLIGKAKAASTRTFSLWNYVRANSKKNGKFDVAMSHGSTDLPAVCRTLGIPHITIFDYEWAKTMHRLNCRLSWRVVVPQAINFGDLYQYGAAGKCVSYPGIKEEYYLEPDSLQPKKVLLDLGIKPDNILAVLRPPADMALYHRGIGNDLFASVIERLRSTDNCTSVILPRTATQQARLIEQLSDDSSIVIPKHAVDGASLVAAADVVVSAGGTMNREAAALGVPVYTVFAGQMGAVDEYLIAQNRMHLLTDAMQVELKKRASTVDTTSLRSAKGLLDILLDGLAIR